MHVGDWMAGSHINCISLFGARGTVDGGYAVKDMAERGLPSKPEQYSDRTPFGLLGRPIGPTVVDLFENPFPRNVWNHM